MHGVDMYSEGRVVTRGVFLFDLLKAVFQALSRQRGVAWLMGPPRKAGW
jgi:hypothetical protein